MRLENINEYNYSHCCKCNYSSYDNESINMCDLDIISNNRILSFCPRCLCPTQKLLSDANIRKCKILTFLKDSK